MFVLVSGAATAADLTGRLTAGIRVDDPTVVVDRLAAEPRLGEEDLFFVSWTVHLDGTADVGDIDAVRKAGAQPWLRAIFTTPAPLIGNLDRLEGELADLAAVTRATGDDVFIQAVWRPEGGGLKAGDLAYLIKRAAVVVTGAAPGAGFTAGPLPPDPAVLEWLYVDEVAAYMDVLVLAPGDTTLAAIEALAALDPGKPVVMDSVPWTGSSTSPLGEVAAWGAVGAALTFVDARSVDNPDLTPMKVAAREFSGRLVHDPSSDPKGADGAWAFVREDLGLRVVAKKKSGDRRLRLIFSDEQLRSPEMVDVETGETRSVTGVQKDGNFVVVISDAPDVTLLRLERPSAAEREGFDEEIDVGGGREMPVEEIIRRLQAFEDDQDRRLHHYQATRSFALRFQAQQGSIELSYAWRVLLPRRSL